MNRTPEELEADNNDVRDRMDSTLEELEQRLALGEMMRAGLDRLRDTDAVRYTAAAALTAGRVAREHPVPTALAGVGLIGLLAWGMRSRNQASAYKSRTYDASSAIGTAKAHLRSAKRMLAESTEDARERASKLGSRAWHHMEDAGSTARDAARRYPLATGAIGLAILALAAAAAMPSVRERIRGN